MKQRIVLPFSCDRILQELERNKHTAYVVGGCVRDSLLGKEPHDWDICTSAKPEEVCTLFRAAGRTVIETGIKHGTVTVLTKANKPYEITTYRVDGIYSDNRHPDNVSFTKDLIEDLARRDFTINAMAYNPDIGVIDPFLGQSDLENKVIRCVGNPDDRFQEDALRILRTLRFASVYRFTIEEKTKESILKNKKLLRRISPERLRDELNKTLVGKNVKNIMQEYREVYAEFLPEIKPCFDFDQQNPYHCYDVWNHTLAAISGIKPELPLRLVMLFHDIGKPECFSQDENGTGHFYGHAVRSAEIAETVMRRLRYDNKTIEMVVELVCEHDRRSEVTPKSVRKLLNRFGEDQFRRWLKVRAADIGAQNPMSWPERLAKVEALQEIADNILTEKDCFTIQNLAVNGKDLLAAGIPEGPQIGQTLQKLLELVLQNPEHNTKEQLLEKI